MNYPGGTELAAQCNTLIEQLPVHVRERFTPEKRRSMLDREKTFMSKVIGSTLELAEQHDGSVTTLFDVDEAIVSELYVGDTPMTYVRPAFATTVQTLATTLGDRFDVGLLTMRSQRHLDEEQARPTYTAAVTEWLNPDFVISSRDGTLFTQHEDLQDYQSGYAPDDISLFGIRKIIKPELAEAIGANDYSAISRHALRGHWFDPKLAILQVLGETHPDRAFTLVDDLPYTTAINPNHPQVRGIYVGDAIFNVRHP